MCNTVYCGFINININTDVQENVQIGCTGYVTLHIAPYVHNGAVIEFYFELGLK